MKKIILVHRWEGTPTSDWYPWIKKRLEALDFEVSIPEMPDTEIPVIEKWVNHISETVELDENTFFIGHSIGCQAILRYLEKVDIKIGGLYFIAPWFNLDNLEEEETIDIAKPWIETPINFEKIKENISFVKSFISSDEPYGYVNENKGLLEEKLSANVVILKNQGHFTDEDGKLDFPELLDVII